MDGLKGRVRVELGSASERVDGVNVRCRVLWTGLGSRLGFKVEVGLGAEPINGGLGGRVRIRVRVRVRVRAVGYG